MPYDVFYAREEAARSGWLYLDLVIMAVVAARHGGTRADVAQARRSTPLRATTVLLTHTLADA